MKYYEINEETARRAKAMYSFNDYIANSETESYMEQVDIAYIEGQKAKERTTEDKHEYIDYLCDKYAKKYAEYVNKGFRIELQCPSVLISGGSNFPVRKKEKQNIARDNNTKYYNDNILPIIEKIKKVGTGAEMIASNDPLAIEKLQEKIEDLVKKQAEMKKMNAYYRKYKTMVGYENLSEDKALKFDECIQKSWYKKPFSPFDLTSINTKIKNAQARLSNLVETKEKGTEENENEYFKIVENAEIMRLQLIFDGKPSDEIRAILKSNGFKWSPNNSAWQRQLTDNARYSVNKVSKSIKETEVK